MPRYPPLLRRGLLQSERTCRYHISTAGQHIPFGSHLVLQKTVDGDSKLSRRYLCYWLMRLNYQKRTRQCLEGPCDAFKERAILGLFELLMRRSSSVIESTFIWLRGKLSLKWQMRLGFERMLLKVSAMALSINIYIWLQYNMIISHLKHLKGIAYARRLTMLPSCSIHYQPNEFDIANVINSLSVTTTPELTILEKLSYFKPMRIYEFFDQFSRQLLFYLADDLALGLGTSIILVSVMLKLAYAKTIVKTQAMAYDREKVQNEFRKIQLQMQEARNQKDADSLIFYSRKMYEMRRENNMFFTNTLMNLTQIPLLITWFISLRYVCSMPEMFPGIKTQGLLWFKDLSTYDPYFIIPILSATFSFINISYSPKLNINIPMLRPVMHYMRFVPFYGLPFLIFFPSAINLYWMISSLLQLCFVMAARNPTIVSALGIKTKAIIKMPQKIFKATILTSPLTVPRQQQTVEETPDKQDEKATQTPGVQRVVKTENGEAANTKEGIAKAPASAAGDNTIKVVFQKPKKTKQQKPK